MAEFPLAGEVRSFFDRYTEAFESVDGTIHCLQSRDELAKFFQDVADTYHRDGYRSGRFTNLQVMPISGRSALATMEWELLRGDGSVLKQWRQSYNVVRMDSEWQILVSTFHVA